MAAQLKGGARMVTVLQLKLAASVLLSLLLLATVEAAKCRRITVFVDGGHCPRGFQTTVGAACANRCSDIPTYSPEGTGCSDCTTECGVGFCASSDGECAAVVAETTFSFGASAAALDECPDPRKGQWPDEGAQRKADESVSRCGDLAELYGLTDDGKLTDAAPPDTRDDWNILGCSAKVCAAWKEVYGVEPGSGWGSLPDQFKGVWDALGCNDHWKASEGWLARLNP